MGLVGPQRDGPARVREQEVAVDALVRAELGLGQIREAPLPLARERVALRETLQGQVAELAVVLMDARERRGNGLTSPVTARNSSTSAENIPGSVGS